MVVDGAVVMVENIMRWRRVLARSLKRAMEVQNWPIDRFVHYARSPRKNDAADKSGPAGIHIAQVNSFVSWHQNVPNRYLFGAFSAINRILGGAQASGGGAAAGAASASRQLQYRPLET